MSSPVSQLVAGRDLDALVAEKVMGWVRELGCFDWNNRWHPDGVVLIPGETTRWSRERHPTSNALTHIGSVPRYREYIADAFTVMEKMRADGWAISIDANSIHVRGDPWTVTFWKDSKTPADIQFTKSGESLPECIVEAALRAVGEATE